MTRIMAPVCLLMICIQFSLQGQLKPESSARKVLSAPPKVISPSQGESRHVDSVLTFRWAPVFLPGGAQAHYRLVITPVFESQSPGDALEQNQPLFSRVLSEPSYEYGGGSPSFSLYPTAVGFAWQVQAVDTGGHPVASNLGKSDISTFKIQVTTPVVRKLIPSTLICGTFRIDVEEYDRPSKSVDPQLLSGIGRVKFTCPPFLPPFPWMNLHPTQKTFVVTEAVSDSLTQIHISEALLLNPTVRVGDKIQVNLPQRAEPNQALADRNLLIGSLKGLKSPGGLRVRFRDVRWTGPLASTVLLSEGTAWYPADPAVPPVPAKIGIEPGFTLSIDSLVITPSRATVRGEVLLPPCIVSATECTHASVKLPWTAITGQCEFYREVPDSAFGPFYVGESGIEVGGRGYTVDFSSVHSDPSVTPPIGNAWKGVVLKAGSTPNPPAEQITSNRGYLKAKYRFENGLISSGGLDARLNLAAQFAFETLEPFGYTVIVRPPDGFLKIASCGIQRGQFLGGEINLPLAAVRNETWGLVRAQYDTLQVQSDMDLFGHVKVAGGFSWGEFSRLNPARAYYQLSPDSTGALASGYFYLAARQIPPYYPLSGGVFTPPQLTAPEVQLQAEGVQGITLISLGPRTFTIWTEDVPTKKSQNVNSNIPKLEFDAKSISAFWMNIIGTGVHTDIRIVKGQLTTDSVKLGPTWSTNPKYQGDSALSISFKLMPNPKAREMKMQFVESATWDSDLNGALFLRGPVNDTVAFTKMVFTSTANAAGAQVDLPRPMNMPYWGVTVVPKDSTRSAGVLCVKLGVVYLTAAGIYEPRHFAAPFWLTWGELKATGNLGRLFFDYNGGGQKFDGIPYTPSFVKLSDYSAAPGDTGIVITYGALAFNFFGSKPIWVYDWKSTRYPGSPFWGRLVRTPVTSPYGTGTTDLHLTRDWGEGVADLNFNVQYDSVYQDGFTGPGSAAIKKTVIFNDPLSGYINIKAARSCFTLNHDADLNFNLGPIFTTSALKKVWGCGCILGDNLERIAVGGELSANAGAGFSILARSAGAVTVVLGYTPSRTEMLQAGDFYTVLMAKNVEVVGYLTLTVDRDALFAEGYTKGVINLDALFHGVSGQGEFQWHFGLDNETIQGRVAISMYSIGGGGSGASGSAEESGIWVGINSNKDDVWVMDGISGRFGLNKAGLPQHITGFYAYQSHSSSIDAHYIFSGGYQTYAGLGAFVGFGTPTGIGFGVVGNVGVYIWGKILGGAISADGWGDLQMVAGIPPAFQGEIGVDYCVGLFFCGTEMVHGGYNVNQGFFLY